MLWACKDEVTGGNTRLVGQTCFPKGLGGLSILDLEKLARDLRFKCLWLDFSKDFRGLQAKESLHS
jgi:hypothetical protein